jgi:hypothetical protein
MVFEINDLFNVNIIRGFVGLIKILRVDVMVRIA